MHEREYPFWAKDDCLGDGIYDRKYIVRREPSISPINSSIAFRLRPITIYLRRHGVTPSMEKRKRHAADQKGGMAEDRRREILFGNHWTPGSGPVCEKVSGSRCLRARRDENLASVFITRKTSTTPILRWPQINQ